MIQEILNSLLGNKTVTQYISSFLFILIGVLISIRLGAFKRDKESPNTPFKFSNKFLAQDNIIRAIGSICIAFVFVRFGEEITGKKITEFQALLLGITFDQLIVEIQNWQKKARINK